MNTNSQRSAFVRELKRIQTSASLHNNDAKYIYKTEIRNLIKLLGGKK